VVETVDDAGGAAERASWDMGEVPFARTGRAPASHWEIKW